MTTNPFYNALGALCYVIFVVGVISIGSHLALPEPEDNILMPIGMISLFVLSAAVMAYLFFYQPLVMLLDGKKDDAVRLFIGTVATFAGLTFCVLLTSVVLFQQ